MRGLTASECNEKKSSGFIQSTGRYVDGQKRNCDERRVLDEPECSRTTLKGIAAALQARGVRTPRGNVAWAPAQIARLLA